MEITVGSPVRRRTLGLGAAGGLLALAGCGPAGPATPATPAPLAPARSAAPQLLVETGGLRQRLGDPALRVLDLRERPAYEAGHVPGALHLLPRDLDAVDERKVTNLKPAGETAALLGGLGVGSDHHVVLYDDAQTVWAGRVFWALDYLGHPRVSVLNGGWPEWAAAGGPATPEAPDFPAATFAAGPDGTKVADRDYILAHMGQDSVVLCDARPAEAWRAGHVPGAANVVWSDGLAGPEPTALLKQVQAIHELYAGAGVTPDKEIITYCGSGAWSAQAYFALRLLGYPRVRLYDGSWQEWSQDAALPVATAPP